MKAHLHSFLMRGAGLVAVVAMAVGATSCMTTYDAYGRPMQTVDPGLAVAGVAAAGLVGYALADNGGRSHHHYHGGRSYGRPHYGGGYRGYYR